MESCGRLKERSGLPKSYSPQVLSPLGEPIKGPYNGSYLKCGTVSDLKRGTLNTTTGVMTHRSPPEETPHNSTAAVDSTHSSILISASASLQQPYRNRAPHSLKNDSAQLALSKERIH